MAHRRLIPTIAVVLLIAGAFTARHFKPREAEPQWTPGLPRLLELAGVACRECALLAPIIAELQTELRGKVDVRNINALKYPEAFDRYHIRFIPLLIFYDAQGKELYRREGAWTKAEILAKMQELGMLPR
jgi:thioredoxin 1